MGFVTPFKSMNDEETDNPLVKIAKADTANSATKSVNWVFSMIPSENWKNDLGSALLNYAQGTGSWDDVQKAFVDNWATEYNLAHES